MSYTFLDAYSSIQTADSSVVSGVIQRPIVDIGSVLGGIPIVSTGNQSVSGTVGASIIGLTPVAVTGSVITVAMPNQSVSGTVGASVIGTVPVTQAGAWTHSVVGTVGASVIGTVPMTQSGTRITSVSGTIVNTWAAPSIVGTYQEDAAHTTADRGLFTLGVRNDAVASFVGANLDYSPTATDAAGRILMKPFAAEEAVRRGRASVVSAGAAGSAIAIAAPGAGLKVYITDATFTNSGATTARVDIADSDGSIIGTTIAPAGGGSNITGMQTPMTTIQANKAVGIVANAASSLITGYLYGYAAP